MKLYGSNICQDCLKAKEYLDKKSLPYTFVNITENTANLKEFLYLRDNNELYKYIKKSGRIGIPTFLFNSGALHLSLENISDEEIIEDSKKEDQNTPQAGLCSFDGC